MASLDRFRRALAPFKWNLSGRVQCSKQHKIVWVPHKTERTIIYGLSTNYQADVNMFKCSNYKTCGSRYHNPFIHNHLLDFGEDGRLFCDKYPVSVGDRGRKLLSYELVMHLNGRSIADPTIGPHGWHSIMIEHHKSRIKSEIVSQHPNMKVEDISLLTQMAEESVISVHFLKLLFQYLYFRFWSRSKNVCLCNSMQLHTVSCRSHLL